MDITKLTAIELSNKIKAKEITVVEAVKASLLKIKEYETLYHCYITVSEEEAIMQANKVQSELFMGKYQNSKLVGVPIAIKDNICTKDIKTTCGSNILNNYIPPYHATVIEKLCDAGAIIIGKTNMDEFGMGSTTETSYFGPTINPRNTEYISGGSSGGSAAAVAAEEAFLALGSDTGGSIRQPSAYCGVTGIKPTYGVVSRYGLIAYASSLDVIGPIGKNVSDCVAALDIIAGYDKKDSTSVAFDRKSEKNKKESDVTRGYEYHKALVDDVVGMKIGIPKGYFLKGLETDVKEAVLKAAKILEKKGAILEEFDLETIEYAIPAYYVIASAEASSNLSRYDGIKYGYRTKEFENLSQLYKKTRSEGFSEEAKRRMMIGTFVLSSGYYDAYYKKALKVKTLIKQEFDKVFHKYDIILGPTTPSVAKKLGESLSDPLKMYLGDIYTVAVNLAGLPAISVPCKVTKNGLPIGLQLIGKPFGERDIIRAAYSYESVRGIEDTINEI